MRRVFLLLALAAPVLALRAPVALPRRAARVAPTMSAKILPAAYAGLAGTLALKATRASTGFGAAVLASTAAVAVVDFCPNAMKQLASTKRAVKRDGSGALAKRWQSVVRAKLLIELGGLVWMAKSTTRPFAGAAVALAGHLGFWLAGGGTARHDDEGAPAPVPPQLVRAIATSDAVVFCSALVAALAPGRRAAAVAARIYLGAMIFVFQENVLGFSKPRQSTSDAVSRQRILENTPAGARPEYPGPEGPDSGKAEYLTNKKK